MKILYGVQGTGNGHISRARAVARHLASAGIQADFIFSGRARDKYFDMEDFGSDWQALRGLTFYYDAGRVEVMRTLHRNSLRSLWREIDSVDLSGYDLVLTDFEPISAWAARRQGKTCIGLGHQYAFEHAVPKVGDSLAARTLMKYFAPTNISLGLHWHHWNAPILPPIAETHLPDPAPGDSDAILVYLGFEEPEAVVSWLEPFADQPFIFYGPFEQYESRGHIQLKPLCRTGFKRDLAACAGVVCNAGFELASETIQLGKKLLVKPLHGQMEQLSNALALRQLGLGETMDRLDSGCLRSWLAQPSPRRILFPDVARAVVEWLAAGRWDTRTELAQKLWEQVESANPGHPVLGRMPPSPRPPLAA